MPNIRVTVRVRPLSDREIARDSHTCIKVQEGTQVRFLGHRSGATQAKHGKHCVSPTQHDSVVPAWSGC